MNPSTLRRLFSPLLVLIALLCCAAKPPEPATVVPMGNNTYTITRAATNAFTRETDKLKDLIQEDATQYCASVGKHLKIVSITDEKPWFGMGYVKAKIVFQALDTAELEASVSHVPDAATAVAMPSPTGDLYSDLLKLDDLHKKGILTEEEFNSEKQKVLNRSH